MTGRAYTVGPMNSATGFIDDDEVIVQCDRVSKQGGNVVTYFCTPQQEVLGWAVGPVSPEQLVVAAEQARKEKNFLKQLSEATKVLQGAPNHRRALFLAGEALLKSGDKVRGCAYLKRSGRKRAKQLGCLD